MKGDIGHDRKDIGMMIKTFCEAFKKKAKHNRPGLILKTSYASFSISDRDIMMKKIQQILYQYGNDIPNVYLLHGDLTDEEMNSLYNHPKVKSMISFTKGEGFGRPLLEFSLTGKPVIASNWSGHIDFLNPEYCVLLPGELTQVDKSASDKMILQTSKWFTVNYGYAAGVLQDVKDNYKKYLEKSRKQPQYIKDNFNLAKMGEMLCKFVDKGLEGVPQQMSLKLPTLKRVAKDETNKIKLPTLKKAKV